MRQFSVGLGIPRALEAPEPESKSLSYGYQWWRLDRDDINVWAALGFGTQALLIIPRYHLVGVVNCWNLFEGQYPNVRDELLSVLTASAMPADN